MKKSQGRQNILFWVFFFLPVSWMALLAAMCCAPGYNIVDWLMAFTEVMGDPFHVAWTAYSLPVMLGTAAIYVVVAIIWNADNSRRRPGEEYGSAEWGNVNQLNKKYMDKNDSSNIILTQNARLSLDGYQHGHNANVLVIGGAGAGKSRGFCKPNIMQADCSYVITDPKGEILRATGGLLKQKGYDVRVLNLVDMQNSDGYNPFKYIQDDNDVLKLITNLMKNTTPKESRSSDPFWDKAETTYLTALMLYLWHEAPQDEQNFAMITYMVENSTASEDDEDYKSPVDMVFDDLEQDQPNHIALKFYKQYKNAAGKTAKSILVSVGVRLASFIFKQLGDITETDGMKLDEVGDRKTAIFAVIPDTDTTWNYLVGMLYTQLFQTLFYRADNTSSGRLKYHVRLIMDEFANIALPNDFARILSTCRSRNISCNIILQNLAQLKELFKDSWEGIVGNCDTFVYLGGNEQGTHEYISKMMGKATIDTRTRGQSRGKSGSTSTNFQQTGRELLLPNEIRQLDNKNALLFMRGEPPVIDAKFDLKRHKNIKLTQDGGAKPYVHNPAENAPNYSQKDLSKNYDLENIEIIEEF